MRLALACAAAVLAAACPAAMAERGPYADTIEFIQYLDENIALEQVRNGKLDLYYYTIPSERLEDPGARRGLQVFDSPGGSYSLLVNPAESDEFNPFSIREARYALNYMVDRKLIVNELMGGFGSVMVSNYGPYDPDYLAILEQTEGLGFGYDPALAKRIIHDALSGTDVMMQDGLWKVNGQPVVVRVFIRSDDPVRKSIGEILSAELESQGFSVKRNYGDLNKAFVTVYGSDPSELKWSIYTEGWGGRGAFVRYDPVGLGQMYAPWFSNMPGFNDPSYWNYENKLLDDITQRIYSGKFESPQERDELVRAATTKGVSESVRIFLAGKTDRYVANENIDGIINDFGAGVPSRFTPINARADSDGLAIGVKHVYQGAWNPVMGLSDSYSTHIWNVLADPGVFKHPYTGESLAVRTPWSIETAGPDGRLAVPPGTITWDHTLQEWVELEDAEAISAVTYSLLLGNWHHGIRMDVNDLLYALYFVSEWGSESYEGDRTFDAEYTPRASQLASSIIGLKQIDEDTITVYTNYWHFDEAEIASRAQIWSSVPWEIYYSMEGAVLDGSASFSRSGATSSGVNWLSLLVPRDAAVIASKLSESLDAGIVPAALMGQVTQADAISRYTASLEWIKENDHAVISNGPFYMDRYSPESRTIRIAAFDDESYPFEKGAWSAFEHAILPKILGIDAPDVVRAGKDVTITVRTDGASKIHYFISNATGAHVDAGIADASSGITTIEISAEKSGRLGGTGGLRVFAISDDVQRPDSYSTSFVVAAASELPQVKTIRAESSPDYTDYTPAVMIAGAAAIACMIYAIYRMRIT